MMGIVEMRCTDAFCVLQSRSLNRMPKRWNHGVMARNIMAQKRASLGVPNGFLRKSFPRGRTVCLASSEASKLLDDGRKKWDAGDRMGALNLWESALKLNPTIEQRLVALYNATAVHASFGDIELAQITLRDAVQNGLDFQKVLEDPESIDPSMVQLKASQQVLIRLKRFAQATEKASKSASQPPMSSGVKSKVSSGVLRSDLSEILETDMQGIDTSALGILKRVVLVILALSALGVGLWFFGLKYLSPLE